MTTIVNIFVELGDGSFVSLPFKPEDNVEDVNKSIRMTLALTGGGLQKKEVSDRTARFGMVTCGEEKISADHDYKFVHGKAGIVSNSV